MPDPFGLQSAGDYVVRIEVFEGPLDLLLHLIEKEELPITSVSLTQITGQYLEYLKTLEQLHPENIADFLVMAARLIYIKSVALLPRPQPVSAEEEEEDPAEALARQLREYKRFKEKAALLHQIEASGQRAFVRLATPVKLEKRLDLTGLQARMLFDAVQELLQQLDAPPRPQGVVEPHAITIEQRMSELSQQLGAGQIVRFRQFLGRARTRVDVIVSFLAVLELIKQRKIRVQQDDTFGDIVIEGLASQPVDQASDEANAIPA